MRDYRKAQKEHFVKHLGDEFFHSINDIMNVPDFIPKHNDCWGNWIYNEHFFFLYHKETNYEVDIERIVTTENITDWIRQVNNKQWASADDVGNLFRAIYDIFDANINSLPDNVKEYLRQRIKDRKIIKETL